MNRIDFASIGFAVLIACIGIAYMYNNMSIADRFASCEVRGGEMRKVDGEWSCKVEARK